MKNQDIRLVMQDAGLKVWEVAEKLGVHPSTLSVWLRYELTPERKATIEKAIQDVAHNKGKEA